jgi:L-ascorbate metabolism protein UlaG (beta-lactamase superfamily)
MKRLRFLRHALADTRRAVQPAPRHPHPAEWPSDRLTVAWLGHATVLINFYGLIILTDPVFFDRVGLRFGPMTIGPKRYIACALRPEEIPPIDLALLSHAHFDHFDLRSIRMLNRDCIIVTAEHTADLLPRRRFREVHEMPWNTERQIETKHGSLALAAFKLRHWGARLQWDVHRRYNAYLLERNGRRLCFCGDTALTDARALGSRGPVDLLIAPISAYNPWITNHCTPEEAVEMADKAGARFVMPVHHQTFKLSWEPMDEPIRRFEAALPAERIALREIGEEFVLEERERRADSDS